MSEKLEARLQAIISFYAARNYVQANFNRKTGKMYKRHRPYNLSSDTLEALDVSRSGDETLKKSYWLNMLKKYPAVNFDSEDRTWPIWYWRNGGEYNG